MTLFSLTTCVVSNMLGLSGVSYQGGAWVKNADVCGSTGTIKFLGPDVVFVSAPEGDVFRGLAVCIDICFIWRLLG